MSDLKARVFVFGGMVHGKVVADILFASGSDIEGFVDDDPKLLGKRILSREVLGDTAWLAEQARTSKVAVLLGLGDNAARERVSTRLASLGIELLTAVHPKAAVAQSAQIGAGTVVMACAAINADADVGRGVIVNTGSVVEHDVVLGDFAHVSPKAALGGGARLGKLTHLGIGATVLPWVCVGDGTVVGGGAVVVRNLPENVVARGVPARVTRSIPH